MSSQTNSNPHGPNIDALDELPAEVWEHGHGRALHAVDGDGPLCHLPLLGDARKVDPRGFRGFRELCTFCFTNELAEEFEPDE